MRTSISSDPYLSGVLVRRRHALVLAIATCLVLALVGLVRACAAEPSRDGVVASSSAPRPEPTDAAHRDADEAIPTITDAPSADPETFAAQVARALFDWDTAAAYSPTDVRGRLLAVADPTGREATGLAADLAGYLPTADGWTFLRGYYTRQHIEIDSVAVPSQWDQAMAEAGPGGLAPGTVAYTVEGVRHRDGVWDGADVSSRHDVAFTVFLVCAPSYVTCHLLRLSRLDEPLD